MDSAKKMLSKLQERAIALLDWMLNPLGINLLGGLALLAFAGVIGWPALAHLLHGGHLNDRVFTGMANNDHDVYMHVWFLLPVSIGFAALGLGFAFTYDGAWPIWRKLLARVADRSRGW